MYRIIQKRRYLFGLSLALLVPGVIAYAVWGLRLGIDFTGGSLLTLKIPSAPAVEDVRVVIGSVEAGDPSVQQGGEPSTFLVRLPFVSNDQRQSIESKLNEKFGSSTTENFETVGPSIGSELRQRAVTAVTLVLLAIIIYITWAFRKASSSGVPSWAYGASALIALVHDLFMVIGVFAAFGHFFHVEINSLFVTALLTVLGFSVHDTIVVYDRIRERLRLSGSGSFEDIVNESLNQTMVRSINTSLATVFVLVALALFGGMAIRWFVIALIIGIVSGTYSSIFVASPLLVVYYNWRHRPR